MVRLARPPAWCLGEPGDVGGGAPAAKPVPTANTGASTPSEPKTTEASTVSPTTLAPASPTTTWGNISTKALR
jgi:hypothetical protein